MATRAPSASQSKDGSTTQFSISSFSRVSFGTRLPQNELEYRRFLATRWRSLGAFVQPHEDRDSTGIPDLSFAFMGTNGWVEVKWLKEETHPLLIIPSRVPYFTPRQRQWLIENGSRGTGHCYLWVGFPGGHHIFRWDELLTP